MLVTRSLAARLVVTGAVFLTIALASIAASLWVTWQLEGGAAAVNEAGRLRMLTYRMAFDASQGRAAALLPQAVGFDRTLSLLRVGDPSRPLFMPASEQSRLELSHVRERWARFSLTPDQHGAAGLVEAIDRLVAAIEQRLAYWTELLRIFHLTMVGLAIGGAVLVMYTSQLLVLAPLRRLGTAIAALRGGDLQARVDPPAAVEFRELALGFNTMADRLQAQYEALEASVQSKTADLQVQQQRMAALYEVSAFIAKADTLDGMARGFVKLLRKVAHADGVALRWSDADNAHYVMLAQDGLPAALVVHEQCLPAGDCHCGQRPAQAARSRVIPIHAGDTSRGHCARVGFQTLLTVPVMQQQHIHGEIDLFYRDKVAADDIDRPLIELLASHLAGGMQGLRAAAIDREDAVSTERTLLAQELHDSIAQSLAFLKIQVQLLRDAQARQSASAVERAVGEIEAGVLESYADVRELLLHFRTRADAEDVEPALRTTLRKFQLQTGIRTEIEVIGHGVALPNDVQIQVLHIVQEALSNVRKHARASLVRLRVEQAPDWRFEVIDDGVGFDTKESIDEGHVGLRIMCERADRIGGELAVRSKPGAGSTVCLALTAKTPATVDQDAPDTQDTETTEDHHAIADPTAGR